MTTTSTGGLLRSSWLHWSCRASDNHGTGKCVCANCNLALRRRQHLHSFVLFWGKLVPKQPTFGSFDPTLATCRNAIVNSRGWQTNRLQTRHNVVLAMGQCRRTTEILHIQEDCLIYWWFQMWRWLQCGAGVHIRIYSLISDVRRHCARLQDSESASSCAAHVGATCLPRMPPKKGLSLCSFVFNKPPRHLHCEQSTLPRARRPRNANMDSSPPEEEYEISECYVGVLCGHYVSLPSGSLYSRCHAHERTERRHWSLGKLVVGPSIA